MYSPYLFKIERLSYSYPETKGEALRDISLTISEGEFILIVGPSGGGKSTLARLLAGFIPQFYGGTLKGEAFFEGQSLMTGEKKDWQKDIGFVFQDPERQIIQGIVENDLAFGVENLGLPPESIKRRVNETLSFFNLHALRNRNCQDLSGGEKQKVALGSILAMMPRVLVLDEPTSQLDPTASQEMVGILGNLHREHGFTIILIDQRIEPYVHLADRIIFMEEGKIILDKEPREFLHQTSVLHPEHTPARIRLVKGVENLPMTVSQARLYLRSKIKCLGQVIKQGQLNANGHPLLDIQNVSFCYGNTPFSSETLSRINSKVYSREFVCVLGENGAGKSTLLKIIAGFLKPSKGNILLNDQNVHLLDGKTRATKIGYLGQNPNDYLFNETVEKELQFTMDNLGIKDSQRKDELLEALGLNHLRFQNPRDLSTGQRQRVALASVIVAQPQVILLDEPTRGLDQYLKNQLGHLLAKQIIQKNQSVILVTQDIDFAAEFADRIILLLEGKIIQEGTPQEVLDGNLFYSTAINRIFRGIVEGVVNVKQAEMVLKK